MNRAQPGGLHTMAIEMQHEPTVVEREEQPYVGITAPITMTTFGEVADRFPEVFGHVAGRGAQPADAPFFRYWVIDMMRELVVEAGVPVAAPLDGDGDVRPGTLPAGRYLTVSHTGHPAELVDVTTAFLAWADEHDLAFDMSPSPEGDRWGCRLEVLLTNPAEVPDMDQWQTQLLFKLA
jgi:effector-binding domain-containing protein